MCMNVLSHLIDKAAKENKFQWHPKCKNLKLTHLCFADDLLLFTSGTRNSIAGALCVFDDFASLSGLSISLNKSCLYTAGIKETEVQLIQSSFEIKIEKLPVRYLGLPLLTKRMRQQDYAVLLDKIKNRFSCWTGRFLSYAGRLQLLKSVIAGILCFWTSAFKLPKKCIKEINKLCSAFLWSGPELNTSKAKIAWDTVCKKKTEGGLGLINMEESNTVSSLKLIWRIMTAEDSLWVSWSKLHLTRGNSFWGISPTTLGSWTWKKLLKLRAIAKPFHKVAIKNGMSTFFWYDSWSLRGSLLDLVGERGVIDLGIPLKASVNTAAQTYRQRNHRSPLLNSIVTELTTIRHSLQDTNHDVHLWRQQNDQYKPVFSTKATWECNRDTSTTWPLWQAIWFTGSTPKYQFIAWLAANNRLSTDDRVITWTTGIQTSCQLCQQTMETRNHLFFECSYSATIWEATTKKLVSDQFSTEWEKCITMAAKGKKTSTRDFLFRYALQSSVYHIWRERNNRRHGNSPSPSSLLTRLIDKNVRNVLLSLRKDGVQKYSDGLEMWFANH